MFLTTHMAMSLFELIRFVVIGFLLFFMGGAVLVLYIDI